MPCHRRSGSSPISKVVSDERRGTMTIPTTPTVVRRAILFFIFLICNARPVESTFSLTVKPGDEECFLIRTAANRASIISGSFELLDDYDNAELFSVRFLELGTKKNTLYKPDAGTMEGTFKLDDKVKPGTRYALCFSNNDKEELLDMDVGFSIRVTSSPRTLPNEEIGPDSLRALALVNKATAIHEDWSSLLDHFDFLRNREATHKQISDATMRRIERWTWIEAILVVSMATAQVLYWRRFFETRRYL